MDGASGFYWRLWITECFGHGYCGAVPVEVPTDGDTRFANGSCCQRATRRSARRAMRVDPHGRAEEKKNRYAG